MSESTADAQGNRDEFIERLAAVVMILKQRRDLIDVVIRAIVDLGLHREKRNAH